MRIGLLVLAFTLAACGQSEEPADAQAQSSAAPGAAALTVYAGAGRNRLCLEQRASRAAFITYGEGDTNCTARGNLEREGSTATLVPDGDESCRIAFAANGDSVTLGPVSPSCSYYCGPKASFAGAEFRRTNDQQPVTDLAGAPLC